ncbi:MAG: phage integrase N-terminal SAM-like domain-containing protein [Methylomicrobium sp.]|nr:phage integrase N-terminal SAM-like domain-containing protein [Methylomicrobium sp.]
MQNTSVSNSENSPKLLDQVRAKIRLKHYRIRTEQAYTEWIKRYILHCGKRHPRDLGSSEAGLFLTHLAVNGKVAAAKKTGSSL